MKSKSYYYALMLTVFLMIIASCKKNNSDQAADEQLAEFSVEEVQELDNTPHPKLTMNDVVLPNGEIASKFLPNIDTAFFNYWASRTAGGGINQVSALDAKNYLVKEFTAVALNVVDKSKHQFPDDGPGKPSQNGIAYSFGSKDFSIRQKPSQSYCNVPVYGMDCSGLLSYIFKNAEIKGLPDGANNQRKTESIQNALRTSFPQVKKIKVEDLGRIPTNKFQSGDIVYWINSDNANPNITKEQLMAGRADHIGLVLKDKAGNPVIVFSNGTQGPSTSDCENNRGSGRGPVTNSLNSNYWFGDNSKHAVYGVVRFNFEIEGKWDFHFRCQGSSNELFVLNLDFPPSTNKSFTISKDFTDYDGSANNATFNFNYDNTTSQLSCEFVITDGSIPGFERKDAFSLTLEKNYGFIPAQQIYIHNGTGCVAEVELVNKE